MNFNIRLIRQQRRRMEREALKQSDALARQRYRIILALDNNESPSLIHDVLGVARSTVYRVAYRFLAVGDAALRDQRQNAPPRKLTEEYMQRLEELIYMTPRELGWQRSTWTTELLALQMEQETGIHFHRTHVWRLLQFCRIRWGRPRPVPPGWAKTRKKAARAREIERLLASLPADEVAVYEDEVDIHLNPKIGPCWMPEGVQFEVETPGKNEKRYIFGGLNPKTGNIVWITSAKKNSGVFIEWLKALCKTYRRYTTIHVICDNYIIHKSKKTLAALATMGRVVLHFLPPYSPDCNPIERLWGELHANITRNHKHKVIEALMSDVESFLRNAIPYPGSQPSLSKAA